jgi:predicted short-subunit dehydrogenase-like oxidoreductase (DUF2520 family)
VASRTRESANEAAARLDTGVFDHRIDLPDVDLVLIGAGDAAIEEVATILAARARPGTVITHFAGSLGLSPLRSTIAAGGQGCALHPVQACPTVDAALARLPGSAWGITCSHALRRWAVSLVERDLRGTPFEVAEEDRPIWHAASVTTSNGIAALMAAGELLLKSIGSHTPADVLGPLASGTVANAREGGGGGATLTGPVARGDAITIERHLRSLEQRSPELLPAYVSVMRTVVLAALHSGRIDAGVAAAMSRILDMKEPVTQWGTGSRTANE